MKKCGVLNKKISEVIAGLGESDFIVICDAGLPIPDECIRIDLALTEGIPGFLNVLEVLMKEIAVEKAILASEIEEKSPALLDNILKRITPIEPDYISHEEFKKMCKGARAIVRTGEFTPYANIALVCGSI
jgi:D-ribose pyranase